MTYSFVVYVTGDTPRAQQASANLRRLCDMHLGPGGYEVDVVDVLEQPERAERDRVIATPTVIRLVPLPRRRVIGDLSVDDEVAHALDLPPLLSQAGDTDA